MKKLLLYSILLISVITGLCSPLTISAQSPDGTGTCYDNSTKKATTFDKATCDLNPPTAFSLGYSWVPTGPTTPTFWYESRDNGKNVIHGPFQTFQACFDDAKGKTVMIECSTTKPAQIPEPPATTPLEPSTPAPVVGPGAAPGSYQLLVPLKGPDGGMITSFNPDDKYAFGKYLNLMIEIFIGLAAVLSMVMIVIGGIEYATSELISKKEAGKERILGAIGGLVLALGAFTVLNQINPALLDITGIENIPGATLNVTIEDTPQIPINGKYSSGLTHGASWSPNLANTPLPNGVSVGYGECKTIGQHGCTSIKGLDLTYVNSIHQNCPNCTIVITEGTATWLHGGKTGSTSHGPGSPTVDLRINANLTNYITGGETPASNKRYQRNGISFLFEGDHWHAGP